MLVWVDLKCTFGDFITDLAMSCNSRRHFKFWYTFLWIIISNPKNCYPFNYFCCFLSLSCMTRYLCMLELCGKLCFSMWFCNTRYCHGIFLCFKSLVSSIQQHWWAKVLLVDDQSYHKTPLFNKTHIWMQPIFFIKKRRKYKNKLQWLIINTNPTF